MKNDRIDRALNYLDDDLISEAADYVPRHRAKPIQIFKYSAAAACLFAVIGGAFVLKAAVKSDSAASLGNPVNTSDLISSVISSLDPPTSSNVSASQNSNPASHPFSSDDDHFPRNPTISELINDPDIVWDNSGGLKDGPVAVFPKLGTVKTTDRLSALISDNPGAVFAVKVSFELYPNETDRRNWICHSKTFGDITIGELENEIKKLSLESNSSEAEGVGKTEDRLREELADALYDYYAVKVMGFIETFNANDIGFYPITSPASVGFADYNYFICFATAEQLESFTCKETEAFVFDIMPRANAEYIF